MGESVVLWSSPQPAEAREAMAELQRLHRDGAVTIRAMAALERDADGQLRIINDADNFGFEGTVAGGVIGSLLGVLAGPAGILLGGAAGVLAGSSADARQSEEEGRIVGAVARHIAPGTAAVVADLEEPNPEVIDAAARSAGGTVVRWSRSEVEAELNS